MQTPKFCNAKKKISKQTFLDKISKKLKNRNQIKQKKRGE